jgi:peptidoglycan hydrolase-like protein with peptidoglycan-binding domain
MNRRWAAIVAVAAIAILAGGWLAAKSFESPAQREARARPPAPEAIVARVTRGTLADEITARATVSPRVSDPLTPQALGERAVVTSRLLEPGATVQAGSALLAINGRPLFALPGRFGFYRDIVAGSSGPDVKQLQDGLAAAGFPTATGESGVYGPTTQAAVAGLYRAAGSEPLTRDAATPPTQAPRVQPAQLPVVPLSEVVVASNLPARLASTSGVGRQLSPGKPVATLASGAFVAHAGVAASVVGRIEPGMDAQLVADTGRAVAAKVLSARGKLRSSAEDLRDVTLGSSSGRLPASWNGANVLARITTRLVRRNALIVPTRAVARGTDGVSYVLKRDGDGSFVQVPVRTLGSFAGRTAIEPQPLRALVATDRVRVG